MGRAEWGDVLPPLIGGVRRNADWAAGATEFGLNVGDGGGLLRAIELDEARDTVKRLLHKGMAYSTEIMTEARAQGWAQEFVDAAGGARFLTNHNGLGPGGEMSGWTPVTDATFDLGVVAVLGEHVVVICATDED